MKTYRREFLKAAAVTLAAVTLPWSREGAVRIWPLHYLSYDRETVPPSAAPLVRKKVISVGEEWWPGNGFYASAETLRAEAEGGHAQAAMAHLGYRLEYSESERTLFAWVPPDVLIG